MVTRERYREPWSGEVTRETLSEKQSAGWRLVAVEWERVESPEDAAAVDHGPRAEVPYGLRVVAEGRFLEEDPKEVAVLRLILSRLVDDRPLSAVAGELNEAGYRTRDGQRWSQSQVFELLPRIVDVGPQIFRSPAWRAERRRLASAG